MPSSGGTFETRPDRDDDVSAADQSWVAPSWVTSTTPRATIRAVAAIGVRAGPLERPDVARVVGLGGVRRRG